MFIKLPKTITKINEYGKFKKELKIFFIKKCVLAFFYVLTFFDYIKPIYV